VIAQEVGPDGELDRKPPAGGERYDEETEAKLDTWVELKKSGDFEAAEIVSEELRAVGINAGQARPMPSAFGPNFGAALERLKAELGKGGGGNLGGIASYGGFKGTGPAPCANPECQFMRHSDPEVSQFYCCQKCEGLHKGEEWAMMGKTKHYKNCEGVLQPQFVRDGWGGSYGWDGKGSGKDSWETNEYGKAGRKGWADNWSKGKDDWGKGKGKDDWGKGFKGKDDWGKGFKGKDDWTQGQGDYGKSKSKGKNKGMNLKGKLEAMKGGGQWSSPY